jgi:hypothetical protein
MANAGLMDVAGRKKPENIASLPGPLEEIGPLERVAQIGLMGDDQRRYSRKAAEKAVVLQRRTIDKLIGTFGARLKVVPFTAEGVPSDEEATLTRDLWSGLSAQEQRDIVSNTTSMVSDIRKTSPKNLPEQTPYAQRLLHRLMWMEANAV